MPDRAGRGHIFAAGAVSLPERGQIGAESIPVRPEKNRNPVEISAEIGGFCASLRRILRDFEKAAQKPSQTLINFAQTGTSAGAP